MLPDILLIENSEYQGGSIKCLFTDGVGFYLIAQVVILVLYGKELLQLIPQPFQGRHLFGLPTKHEKNIVYL